METPQKGKRFRKAWFIPRFRLRSFLWMFIIVGILALWYRDRENLKRQEGIVPVARTSWNVDQLLGAPDTRGFGDISTAWASKTQDGQEEWLILEYPKSRKVNAVHIHETYTPGAVTRIDAVDWQGNLTQIWKGTDPTPVGSPGGISKIKLAKPVSTRRIKVTLDSKSVRGWNEIDAVGLMGTDGTLVYATNSWASSCYGDNREAPDWYWP